MKYILVICCILGGVVFNTIPRWIAHIDGNLFCKYQALSFLLLTVGATMSDGNRYIVILWQWVTLLALNNAYDEIFGNPFKVGWIEITFAITVTLWTIYRIARQWIKNPSMKF